MLERLNWTEVSGEQRDGIIGDINTISADNQFDPQNISVKAADLSFYKDVMLLELSDNSRNSEQSQRWYLYNEKLQVHLDGSSAPIHDMNDHAKIALNGENVEDYVRFFGFFVHGDEGPFFIVENADFPAFDRKKIDFLLQKKIKDTCKTLELTEISDKGVMIVNGTVFYGDALFSASFAVTSNGMIEMIDDDPLVEGIAARKIKPNY